MDTKKYELVEEDSIEVNLHALYRIRALRDFGDVKKGDLGGYIEKEENLSQEGNCWVYDNAKIFGNAKVYENAKIKHNANVFINAKVYGNVTVCNNATIYGDSNVYEKALVMENSRVFGSATVHGNAEISGFADVFGNAEIHGEACVDGNAIICNNSNVFGRNTEVSGNAAISSNDSIIFSNDDYLSIDKPCHSLDNITFVKTKYGKISCTMKGFKGTLEEFKEIKNIPEEIKLCIQLAEQKLGKDDNDGK